MKEKLRKLLNEIHGMEGEGTNGMHFLRSGDILCRAREYGDSRYPLETDGLCMWAHTSGYIDAYESTFNIFRTANYNEDAVVLFYAGEKRADGGFTPISLTGADAVPCGAAKHYIVFSQRSAWYIAETERGVYAVRLHVAADKRMHFSVYAENVSDADSEIYIAAYFEPFLRFIEAEGFFNRMTKYARRMENGRVLFWALNAQRDCMTLAFDHSREPDALYRNIGRRGVLGRRGNNLTNATAWQTGRPTEEKDAANTTDLPASCDIAHYKLAAGEDVRLDFIAHVVYDYDAAKADCENYVFDADAVDAELESASRAESDALANMNIRFGNYRSALEEDDTFRPLDAETLNAFINKVKKQVSLCALGKNYAGNLLGIRDVFQQLESSLIWQPEESRRQIVRVLDFILDTGRAPRQIGFPAHDGDIPEMDLRPYIDQGLWIISTLYSYLSWTGDFSILDEPCGYYTAAATYGPLTRSPERTDVLEHIVRIADFLISNLDPETHCLHSLYGDWNDALDGLGRTSKDGLEFGCGVSVMASLQLYQALNELTSILDAAEKYTDRIDDFNSAASELENGLMRHAYDPESRRVIHGWGDDGAYKVGSVADYDGEDRISITPNAFWAISDMSCEHPETADGVARAIKSLDSKYGLLTFSRALYPFDRRVGRISTITPGTYENCAVYVHASLFGGMALFNLGESREAWRQLEKALTVTHKNATMTSFVMPNSYCYAPEWCADGDSMGDWYTGSGTVLIKELVRHGLGVYPLLGRLMISTPAYMPTDEVEMNFTLRGKKVTFRYKNTGRGARTVTVDGKDAALYDHPVMKTKVAFIGYPNIGDGCVIEVCD